MKPAEPTSPEEFGPYIVYERLGVGGMATVHRAKKRGIAGFERVVALKRMLPHLAEDVEFINSFVREAKLASMLVHPNIAQIYDFGRVAAVYFIAMELVDGFDVRKMLRYSNRHKEPLPLNVVMSILCELCDALEYAHTFVDEHGTPQGIVHRDVSPSNLIVAQSGHLKVIDFGIAKANVRQLHTESGRVKGKLGYMSPEAVTGRAFGPVSDVFSAGVVAHELLTAHPLFSAKTDYDTLIRIHEAEIPPPSRRNPSVPPALDEVVLAALCRDPDRRLQSAGAFRQGLEYVAEQTGIRFSSRDVAEWRAKIATTEDPWGSRTSLPGTSASGARFPFPESRSSISGSQAVQRPDFMLAPTQSAPPERLAPSGLPQLNPDMPGEIGDDDKSVADLTWGLDPVQASSIHPVHPLPDQAMMAMPQSAQMSAPTIGAAIAAPRRNTAARLALVVLFAVAAGLAVYRFVLAPTPPPVKPAPPPAPVVATLKFDLKPSDAIVEIAGKEAGRSSPFDTKLEPGMYSIAIHRQGYKPVSTQVTLSAGESQTVHLALELGQSRLIVVTPQPGLTAVLDGKPLDQLTPLDVQVAAGQHHLSVTNSSGAEWTQDFTGDPDGQYAFHPTFTNTPKHPTSPSQPSPPSPPPQQHQVAVAPPPPPSPPPSEHKRPPASISHGGNRDSGDEVKIVDEPATAPPTPPPPAPTPPPKPAVVPEPAKPAPVAVPQGPRTPPLVAAPAKVSGSYPQIRGVDAAEFTGKVCIDERGRVTSVKLTKGPSADINSDVQEAMMGWRYQPYTTSSGQPGPACFLFHQRVEFKQN